MTSVFKGRALVFLVIISLVALWWYASTLEWRAEREAERILSHEVSAESFSRIPLSAKPHRQAARRLMVSNEPDYEYIDALLAESIARRPLYAPYYLDRATAAFQSGQTPQSLDYAANATRLWPTRPVHLWRIAMLYARMDEVDLALGVFRDYLTAKPNGYRQVVAVAGRLEPDPASMVTGILPERIEGPLMRDDLVWRILRTAIRSNDPALGRAAWREFSPEGKRKWAARYVEWLAEMGSQSEAVAAWHDYRGGSTAPILENGGFEEPMEGGLGWRSWETEGVTLGRDDQVVHKGGYSLKLAFSGEENLVFSHLRQYLQVEPATTYTLSYAWRGQDITTRSGPYIEIRRKGVGRLVWNPGRWGSWNWEQQEMTFTVPRGARFVEVRIRRNPTDALDNKIGGSLWLDEFKLEPAVTEARDG